MGPEPKDRESVSVWAGRLGAGRPWSGPSSSTSFGMLLCSPASLLSVSLSTTIPLTNAANYSPTNSLTTQSATPPPSTSYRPRLALRPNLYRCVNFVSSNGTTESILPPFINNNNNYVRMLLIKTNYFTTFVIAVISTNNTKEFLKEIRQRYLEKKVGEG